MKKIITIFLIFMAVNLHAQISNIKQLNWKDQYTLSERNALNLGPNDRRLLYIVDVGNDINEHQVWNGTEWVTLGANNNGLVYKTYSSTIHNFTVVSPASPEWKGLARTSTTKIFNINTGETDINNVNLVDLQGIQHSIISPKETYLSGFSVTGNFSGTTEFAVMYKTVDNLNLGVLFEGTLNADGQINYTQLYEDGVTTVIPQNAIVYVLYIGTGTGYFGTANLHLTEVFGTNINEQIVTGDGYVSNVSFDGTNLNFSRTGAGAFSGGIDISTDVVWGNVIGDLSNQTDLQNVLNSKQNNITLTNVGIGGTSTLINDILNIPEIPTDNSLSETNQTIPNGESRLITTGNNTGDFFSISQNNEANAFFRYDIDNSDFDFNHKLTLGNMTEGLEYTLGSGWTYKSPFSLYEGSQPDSRNGMMYTTPTNAYVYTNNRWHSIIDGAANNIIYRNVITSNTTLTAQDIDDFTQFYIDGTGITVTLPTTILAADEVKYLFFTAPNEDDFTVVGGAGVTFPSTVYSGVSKVALRSYVQNTWEEDTSYPSAAGGTQDLQSVIGAGDTSTGNINLTSTNSELRIGQTGGNLFTLINDGAFVMQSQRTFGIRSTQILDNEVSFTDTGGTKITGLTGQGPFGLNGRYISKLPEVDDKTLVTTITDGVTSLDATSTGVVDISSLLGGGGSDNLGNHIATSTLDLNDNDIINVKDIQINDYGLGASANKIGLRGSYGLEISLDNTSSSSSERSWFFGNYLDRAMIAYAGGGGTFDRTSLDMNPVIGVNKRFIMPAKPAGTYTMATLEDLTPSGIDRTPVIVSDSTYTALEADLLNNKIHLFTNAVADSIRVTIPDIVKPNTDIIEFRARTMSETPITVIRDTIQFIPRIMDESFSIASTDDDVWVKWDNVNKVNWVDPGPVMGPELLLNTTFDNSTNVTVDGFNTWSIAGGVANFNDTRDNVDLTFTTNNITAGDYIFAYDIPSGAPRISLEVGATEVMGITFVSTGTQVEIPFTYAGADSTTFIVVAWSGAGGSAFDLDNVTLKKVQ